jgi:putative membrane protein
MRFLTWWLTTAAGVAIAAWLLDGISFDGTDWQDKVLPLLGVALILGLVTTFVRPIITLLSLPFILLTLGLLLLVINALMLLLTARLADAFDLGFTVDGFWAALLGSVVITIATWAIDAVVDDG